MKPAFPLVMIRLWPHHHENPVDLDELLSTIAAHPGCCDEVWFCTAWGFSALESHRNHAKMIGTAAARFRELGIQTGLQIANTFGHGCYPFMAEEGATWRRMTGSEGQTATLAPCPRDPDLLVYTAAMADCYAPLRLSSVWIDDDLRMSSHQGVPHGCFCDVCVEAFSSGQRKDFTRQTLVEDLHRPENGALRLAWTRFNGKSLARIASIIGKSFHRASPGTRLAFQQLTHERFFYSGPDWKPIYDALAAESDRPTGARLGNSYYVDHNPREVLNKAFAIGRQVALLPTSVGQICPEIESFPHTAFSKTPQGLMVESALALAMGCNSLSYAILCSEHEPVANHARYLHAMRAHRPFWEDYLFLNEGTQLAGIEIPMSRDQATRRPRDGDSPFAWASINLDSIYQMATLGVPLIPSGEFCNAAILHPDAIDGFSDHELENFLTKGALLTGEGAFRIQQRGLGRLLGVGVIRHEKVSDLFERISDDPLNGSHAGRPWALWLSAGAAVYSCVSTPGSVRSLGNLEKTDGSILGSATTLCENSLGGRIAIFGYSHWVSWSEGHLPSPSTARWNQFAAAADWVAHERLPVRLHTPTQLVVLPRVAATGALRSVFILNPSIDHSPEIVCEVRAASGGGFLWKTPDQPDHNPEARKGETSTRVSLPSLPPWSFGVLAAVRPT
ncbi:MAG: hypothetical protein IAE94_09985 [Chthoniobacterales bacterium]|nr:hypothetical protein [Chthoniobacterales bacterium]